jgi:hypothetical protein
MNSARPMIDVSTTRTRAVSGIEPHRAAPELDRTTVDGIPCATTARTLLDLADLVSRKRLTQRQLGRAVERAEALLIVEANLPRPLVNVPLYPDLVPDFMWPDYKLIVETDGWETHGPRAARQRDLKRDRRLVADGWRVIRFTWADVTDDPDEVVRTLRSLLRSSGS